MSNAPKAVRFEISDPYGLVLTMTRDEAIDVLRLMKGDPDNGAATDAMLTQLEEWVGPEDDDEL